MITRIAGIQGAKEKEEQFKIKEKNTLELHVEGVDSYDLPGMPTAGKGPATGLPATQLLDLRGLFVQYSMALEAHD